MRFKKSKTSVVEVDMTPMIDMTFQLIAFFMIVSNFEQTQADERVLLPVDQLAKPPEISREYELVINVGFIRENNQIVDPVPWVFWNAAESVRVLETLPLLQRKFRLRKDRDGEEAAQDTYIVIRADAATPTGLVQELIKLAQEAGFHRFVLSAEQTELTPTEVSERMGS